VINEPCIGVKDNSCVVCPVDCIHPTPDEPDYDRVEQLYIDPGRMHRLRRVRRGLPYRREPPEDMVPAKWQRYIENQRGLLLERRVTTTA
jgi:ferredoxin